MPQFKCLDCGKFLSGDFSAMSHECTSGQQTRPQSAWEREAKQLQQRAEKAEAERATLAAQVRGLTEALTAIMEQEQIDGVGGGRIMLTFNYRSPLAEKARAALAQVSRATETEP